MYSSGVPEDKYTKAEKKADNKALQAAADQNWTAATDWNDYVTSFNQTLKGGLSQQADDFYNSIQTTDIGDYSSLDDFDSLIQSGTSMKSLLDKLDLRSQPTLIDDIAGTENILYLDDLPNLKDLKLNMYEGATSDVSQGLSALDRLRAEWQTEANRVDSFQDSSLANIAQYGTLAGQLGIRDEAMMNQLAGDISAEQARINAFSSPLLDALGGVDAGGLSEALSRIEGLRGERQAELDRISSFEGGLQSSADNLYNSLSGLTINDEEGIQGLLSNLEEGMRSGSRFSSVLPFDLSQEMAEYQAMHGAASGLMGERKREQDRWDAFANQTSSQARDLERAMENSGINVYQNIDSFQKMIEDLTSGTSNYKTDLDVDRTQFDSTLGNLQTALQDLIGRRAAAVDPLDEELDTIGQTISGLDLRDVDARKSARSDLNQLIGKLGVFSGGRVPELLDESKTYMTQLDELVAALDTERSGIETSGQSLLEALQGGSYTNQAAVDGGMSQYNDLLAQIDEYGATGASDEAEAILQFLQGETNRLQQEEQNRIAATNKDQSLAQAMIGNNALLSQIRQAGGSNYLTDAQIMQLMSGLNNEDEDMKQFILGAFSKAMGV